MKRLIFILLLFGLQALWAQDQASEGETEWDDGILHLKSNNGKFETHFDIRMYINGAIFFEDGDHLSNGTHLRKARFAMKTKLWDVWRAEWDIDVAEGLVEVKDMFFSYRGFENSHIKIGHFKMPLGLNELTSSRFQTFVERAYAMSAFEVDRRAGLEYSSWSDWWNLRLAVFGQPMDTEKNKSKDETGGGFAGRLVAAQSFGDLLVHAGAAGAYEIPDNDNNVVDYNSEPETKMGDVEILDTDNIFDVDHVTKIGLEGVVKMGTVSLQAEYIQTNLSRMNGAKDASFDGGYAFISWILTGEERPWDNTQGEFGQIIPNDNIVGAWELAARFSHLNLSDTDAGIAGGKANNITLGLNWYMNPNMRILLNYTMVDNSVLATGDGLPGNYDFSVLHAMAVIYF